MAAAIAGVTRSGRRYAVEPIFCPAGFNFQALLQASVVAEMNASLDDSDASDVTVPVRGLSTRLVPTMPHDSTPQEPRGSKRPQVFGSTAISRDHARQKRRRLEKIAKEGHVPSAETYHKHVKSAISIPADLDMFALPATSGAYGAKPRRIDDHNIAHTVIDLMEQGFEYIVWDGFTCRPVVERIGGKVVLVLVGQPKDPSYQRSVLAVYDLLEEEAKRIGFGSVPVCHRRGEFSVLNVGVVHQQGTEAPVNLNNDQYAETVSHLLQDQDVQRMALFGSASLRLWSPGVFNHHKERLDKLFGTMPHLKRIFPGSVYTAAAFNFGPNVWTYKHRDVMNCPFGWCAIQALGRFNPEKGGHLVLEEPKMIIEFPAGALILIPSATITHFNIPVAEGDVRASFTQYCSGGLFRYVDYGFRTEKTLLKEDPQLFAEIMALKSGRWAEGLKLISNFEDLKNLPL